MSSEAADTPICGALSLGAFGENESKFQQPSFLSASRPASEACLGLGAWCGPLENSPGGEAWVPPALRGWCSSTRTVEQWERGPQAGSLGVRGVRGAGLQAPPRCSLLLHDGTSHMRPVGNRVLS